MIVKIIIILLVLLAAVIFVFIASLYLYQLEKEREEKEKRRKAERYSQAITMCLRARQTKVCPGVCSKCAWSVENAKRMAEFRGK